LRLNMSSNTKMRIRLYSFDSTVLENAVRKLIQVILKSGGQVVGPVPLKTKKKRISLPRSTFVYSKHRDTFECRTHKRLIDVYNINNELVNNLSTLSLPAGVDINIETINLS